jgi:hypothetical protein
LLEKEEKQQPLVNEISMSISLSSVAREERRGGSRD